MKRRIFGQEHSGVYFLLKHASNQFSKWLTRVSKVLCLGTWTTFSFITLTYIITHLLLFSVPLPAQCLMTGWFFALNPNIIIYNTISAVFFFFLLGFFHLECDDRVWFLAFNPNFDILQCLLRINDPNRGLLYILLLPPRPTSHGI